MAARVTGLMVGVAGHRVLTEIDRLEAGIDRAFARLDQAWPDRAATIVSSLAEGADRLVIDCARRRGGASLIAVLPLARAEYIDDFKTAESRDEFERLLESAVEIVELDGSSRDEAYLHAGFAVLDRSDVLIAVWDGQESQGEGGTAPVVVEARARGMPLLWVHAGNRMPGTEHPTSLGDDQGILTTERI